MCFLEENRRNAAYVYLPGGLLNGRTWAFFFFTDVVGYAYWALDGPLVNDMLQPERNDVKGRGEKKKKGKASTN